MTAGLAAGDDQDIDAGFDLTYRVFACADQSGDRHTMAASEFKHDGRRYAERVRNQFNRMLESDSEELSRPALAQIVAELNACAAPAFEVARLDAVSREDLVDEGLVRRRYCIQLMFGRKARVFTRHMFGDQEIHTIGFAINVLIDPRELFFETSG